MPVSAHLNFKVEALARATSLLLLAAAGPAAAHDAAGPTLRLAQATTAAAPSPAPAPVAAALKPIPKPVAPSKAEAEFTARLDKALAPIRNYPLSAADAALVRDAVKAVTANERAKVTELAAQIQDPVAGKLVDWLRLRAGFGTPPEYKAFLAKNAAWPDRKLMTQRLEEEVFRLNPGADTVKSYFKDGEPQTGAGMAALASAYLASGDQAKARSLAVRAWREESLAANLEAAFLARFGPLLTPADHKWKLDRLIVDEVRWQGDRKERAAAARRVIALLPPGDRAKAEARLGVFLAGGKAKPQALDPAGGADWGLVFHRVQSLRKSKQGDEAAKLLLTAPTDPEKIPNLDEWWVERRQNAYEALKRGNAKLAYDLVRDAGPITVNPLKEQQFMAGWLALRYLKNTGLAEPHFQAMKKAADGPLSRAKASYWLGRTAEAKGDMAAAKSHYRVSAEQSDTFHGLLSRGKLQPGRQPLNTTPPATASGDEIARFVALDAVKAIGAAAKAGVPPHIARAFVVHLRTYLQKESEVAMVAHLADLLGDTQLSVQTGKTAIANGQNLVIYAYPVHPFPAYTPLRRPPEPAYLLGIARQETEFNRLTVSGAGAKGLLQVMTVTANHVCRDYRIKCDIPRLLSDISYNTMIASAYISDRMDEFSGSYILGAAGYNAGPGRAREWIREFGDPRDPKVDPIDWIERIPIQETREYVSKVLANVQMYRARLGQEPALRLDEDLLRGRAGRRPGAAAEAQSDG